MPSSHATPQVCRPHFHTPLSPWLTSEHKSFAPASAWGMGQFACPQEPQVEHKLGQVGQSHQTTTAAGQHSFPFPPTPPKDSTPDSVQTGPSEYQVSTAVPQSQPGHIQQSLTDQTSPLSLLFSLSPPLGCHERLHAPTGHGLYLTDGRQLRAGHQTFYTKWRRILGACNQQQRRRPLAILSAQAA